MTDEEFYEDDEPITTLRAAWNASEGGVTSGSHHLNREEMSAISRAVTGLEGRRLQVVESGTSASTDAVEQKGPASPLDFVEKTSLIEVAYQAG